MNVRPIKPHIHANLKSVCTDSVRFYVNVVCEGVWILLSVMGPLHRLGFYFIFLTLMSNFVLLTESLWDTELESATKMAILSMVKHCAIPELPSPETTALSHLQGYTYQWTDGKKCMKHKNKSVLVLVAKVKRLERGCGDRQIMKRDCISLKMSVFFFGTLPLQLITCIKMYRWWNLLLNVREIMEMVKY